MSADQTPGEPDSRTGPWKKRIVNWILVLVVGYLLIMVMLVILEPFLLFPAPREKGLSIEGAHPWLSKVELNTSDDVKISGLLFEPENTRGVILFFHGNGEWLGNLTNYVVNLGTRMDCSVFAIDYRGYGDSAGSSSAKGIELDGQAAYDFLINKGYQPDSIVVFGRSLGGGVAVFVASENEIGALVLRSTFSSLTDVAAAKFPWLPVRALMRNRMNSVERISDYKGPLLQRHGTDDRVIPIRFGQRLFEAAGTADSEKLFVIDSGATHVSPASEEFKQSFKDLVDQTLATPN